MGVRARPGKLLSAQRHPRGQQGYLRSSPTLRISHSILVSSMLLRPKGHSCLSSRLLFSSTICKQEGDSHRGQSCAGAEQQPPSSPNQALGAGPNCPLGIFSAHTVQPKTHTCPSPPKACCHPGRGRSICWLSLTEMPRERIVVAVNFH